MCGCECFIYATCMHPFLLTYIDLNLKKLKYHTHNLQNRLFSEMKSHILETYNYSVIPQGSHLRKKAIDISMPKMCTFTYYRHVQPQ